MTVKEWIRKNPKKKYSVFKYSEFLKTYVPFTQSYSLIMTFKVERVEEVQVFENPHVNKDGLVFHDTETRYNIFLKRNKI